MCDRKIAEKIDKGEALVFTKARFYLSVAVILVSIIGSFITMQIRTETNIEDIKELKTDRYRIEEVQYNLKSLCNHFNVKYIEHDR